MDSGRGAGNSHAGHVGQAPWISSQFSDPIFFPAPMPLHKLFSACNSLSPPAWIPPRFSIDVTIPRKPSLNPQPHSDASSMQSHAQGTPSLTLCTPLLIWSVSSSGPGSMPCAGSLSRNCWLIPKTHQVLHMPINRSLSLSCDRHLGATARHHAEVGTVENLYFTVARCKCGQIFGLQGKPSQIFRVKCVACGFYLNKGITKMKIPNPQNLCRASHGGLFPPLKLNSMSSCPDFPPAFLIWAILATMYQNIPWACFWF